MRVLSLATTISLTVFVLAVGLSDYHGESLASGSNSHSFSLAILWPLTAITWISGCYVVGRMPWLSGKPAAVTLILAGCLLGPALVRWTTIFSMDQLHAQAQARQEKIVREVDDSRTLKALRDCAKALTEQDGERDAGSAMRQGDFRIAAIFYAGQEVISVNVPGPFVVTAVSCDGFCSSEWVEGRRFPADSIHRYPLASPSRLIGTSDPWGRQTREWQKTARECDAKQNDYVAAYNRTILATGAEILDGNGYPTWLKASSASAQRSSLRL